MKLWNHFSIEAVVRVKSLLIITVIYSYVWTDVDMDTDTDTHTKQHIYMYICAPYIIYTFIG